MPARKGLFGSGSSIGVVLLIVAILGLVNIIAVKRFARLDLTQNREYTVTKSTKAILAGLDDVVNVTVYFSKDLPPYLATLDRQVKDLLDEYKAFSGGKLRIQFEDPGSDPTKERSLQMIGIPKVQLNILEKEKAQVTNVYLGIAIQYADKSETIPIVQSTENLEYDLTSAILKVTQAPPKVGLLTGHGEATLERGQMSGAGQALQKQYEVTNVDISGGQPVPADIRTLIVARPTQRLGDRDRYEIDQFVMRGGRLIVLADGTQIVPQQLMAQPFDSGLNELLSHYGARIGSDLLLDASHVSTAFSNGSFSFMMPYPFFPRILPDNLNRKHPVTSTLQSIVTPWVSSLETTVPVDTTGAAPEGGVHAEILAKTTKQSFRLEGQTSINPQQRLAPPNPSEMTSYPVAVSLTGTFASAFAGRPAPPPPDSAAAAMAPNPATVDRSPSTQIIVVADADFASDQFTSQYPENLTFFLNAVDWCTLGDQLIAIRSRANFSRPLKPVPDNARGPIKLANMLVMPLLVGAWGLFRWYNRRRAQNMAARYR
ncbi:MAG TPA: Gldg family protein [Candidatus Eisenbacteria bacterium]